MSTNNQETQLNLAVASEVVELNDNDLGEVAGGCGHHNYHPKPAKKVIVRRVAYHHPCNYYCH